MDVKELLKGKIIAFEGMDCSFKETQHKLFVDRLSKEIGEPEGNKYRIFTESFPRYNSEASYFVTRFLNNDYVKSNITNNSVINTMYALDRFDYWNRKTIELIRDDKDIHEYFTPIFFRRTYGGIFVFDRYSSSSALYHPQHDRLPSKDDLLFDYKIFNNPNPDIVVLLYSNNISLIYDNIQKKRNKDINEKSKDVIRNSYYNLQSLLNEDTFSKAGIKCIPVRICDKAGNAFRSREDIAEEVWIRVLASSF